MDSDVTQTVGASSVAEKAARRLIARVGKLEAAVRSRPAQRVIQTWRRRRAVRSSGKFLLAELAGWPSTGTYRLRDSAATVVLRHRTRDAEILDEIFVGEGAYEPPPAIARVLEAVDAPAVVDLGGNIGLFGAFVLGRFPGARVTSFEPDPANAALLHRAIAANGAGARWSLVEACVGPAPGTVAFAAGAFADSRVVSEAAAGLCAPATIDVACVDVFSAIEATDFLKIDIEGSEWPILRDPRLRDLDARVLVLEWHAGEREPSLARAEAEQLLAEAGYTVVGDDAEEFDHGTLWGCRDRVGS